MKRKRKKSYYKILLWGGDGWYRGGYTDSIKAATDYYVDMGYPKKDIKFGRMGYVKN